VNPFTVDAITHTFPRILPEALLCLAACAWFLGGTWLPSRKVWGSASLVALLVAQLIVWWTPDLRFDNPEQARAALYSAPLWADHFTMLVKTISLVGIALLVLLSWHEVADEVAAEYYGCLLTIAAGMCFTAGANELVVLFLALELISIPTYVLLYLVGTRTATPGVDKSGGGMEKTAQEAALKYFLLSVFSSGLLLFGFSYLYGLTGTTNLRGITDALTIANEYKEAGDTVTKSVPRPVPGMLVVAVFMVVAGLGFKITAVPFHYYAADVYQGTTTSSAALLAFVPKVAGFVALLRVFGFLSFSAGIPGVDARGPVSPQQLSLLLWILAAVTMTTGNVLALWQDNLKRLLAYSSVAHAGYMLIGLAVGPFISTGTPDAILFYLVAYGAMTLGAFGMLSLLSTPQKPIENIRDLEGLGKSRPLTAFLFSLLLFSLIGIPATAGFWGKAMLFVNAMSVPFDPAKGDEIEKANWFRILTLIGAINAAIGGWYYLRLVATMYLVDPAPTTVAPPKPKLSPLLVGVGLCVALTMLFGVVPSLLTKPAQTAAVGKVKGPWEQNP